MFRCSLSPFSVVSRASLNSCRISVRGKSLLSSHTIGDKKDSLHPSFDTKKVNTVGKLLDATEDLMSHRDVFRHVQDFQQWTYSELKKNVDSLAVGLPEVPMKHSDVIALMMHNDCENFALRLGAIRVGIVPAHIDIRTVNTPESVHDYLAPLAPKSLVLTPKYDNEKKYELINQQYPQIPNNCEIGNPLKIPTLQSLTHAFQTHKSKAFYGWYSIKDIIWADPFPGTLEKAEKKVSPSDIAEIHHSRYGPERKAHSFTHESVVQSTYNYGATGPFSENRVAFTGEFSTPEVMTGMLSCLTYGSLIVTSNYTFRATSVLKNLVTEQCGVLVTTPDHLEELLEHPLASSNDFKHLHTLVVVNNPLDVASPSLLKSAKEKFGLERVDVSLITDGAISPFLHSTVTDFDAKNFVGKPILHTEAKIVNEAGKVAKVGELGRLFTKGAHTAKGDEWLDTLVTATMDDKGNYSVL